MQPPDVFQHRIRQMHLVHIKTRDFLVVHPDDPPFPLLGLPRIASTLEDFQWILSRYDSTVNGVTFCAGSLSARPDNDLPAMARALAPRIHFVHLRNTQRSGPRDFYESGHLVGSVDMYAVLRALLEEQRREVESDLEKAVEKGRRCGLKDEEIRELFDLIMED